MKKKLAVTLALAFILGIAGTAFADSNPFVDVPAKHWSYDAVSKLAKAGIVDGYSDKTFQGDKTLTRYEMAQIVAKAVGKLDKANAEDKALLKKLYTEYNEELRSMNVRVSSLEGDVKDLKAKSDKLDVFGFVRTKYDSDTIETNGSTVNHNGGNKHTYMDFEGTMKVNDTWAGHFQLELNKQYTNSTWANANGVANQGSTDNYTNDGTIQRAWVTGSIGKVGVTAGKKWWGYASNVLYGHAGSGVQLDLPIGNKTTLSAFDIRPSQGSGTLISNALYQPENTSIYGGQITSEIGKGLNATVVVGGNHKSVDVRADGLKEVTNWSAIDLSYKFAKDWKVTGTYVKTNADDYNKSTEARLDYRGADLNTPGSYGAYFRYVKFELQGDISHDDEWSSLPGDMKGWILGVDYVLAKNIQWTTLYSDQKINTSGYDKNLEKDTKRKLFRTQVDFHF